MVIILISFIMIARQINIILLTTRVGWFTFILRGHHSGNLFISVHGGGFRCDTIGLLCSFSTRLLLLRGFVSDLCCSCFIIQGGLVLFWFGSVTNPSIWLICTCRCWKLAIADWNLFYFFTGPSFSLLNIFWLLSIIYPWFYYFFNTKWSVF